MAETSQSHVAIVTALRFDGDGVNSLSFVISTPSSTGTCCWDKMLEFQSPISGKLFFKLEPHSAEDLQNHRYGRCLHGQMDWVVQHDGH
jgi:hypothetical protein